MIKFVMMSAACRDEQVKPYVFISFTGIALSNMERTGHDRSVVAIA